MTKVGDVGPQIVLSMGEVVGRLTLLGAPAPLLAAIRQQYAGFTLPCSPRILSTFNLTVTFGEGPDARTDDDGAPVVAATDTRLQIARDDFQATLDLTTPRGPWVGAADCQTSAAAFEGLLRVLWSVFLSRRGAGLFHACGFQQDKQGYLAIAGGGRGTSTLPGKVTDPDQLLGDRAVIVQPAPAGHWRIAGTPFSGQAGRGAGSLQSFPLKAVAFLDPGSELQVSRLPRAEAVLRALESLICFQTDAPTVERNLALVLAICAQTPTVLVTGDSTSPLASILTTLRAEIGLRERSARAPESSREMISSLRAKLARHGSYAFRPSGGSMRPYLRSGDSLFIEALPEHQLAPGDVILYWRAGATAADDALICHRLVGRGPGARIYTKGDALGEIEAWGSGCEAEILGRVQAVSRAGRTWAVPSRLGSVALLGVSLLLSPLWKARWWP